MKEGAYVTKEKFICNQCGKHTHLIKKVDYLENDIEHHYAECEHCFYRSTIFYQNAEIKVLMYQQRKTKFGTKKKQKLFEEIESKTEALKNTIENNQV